MPIFLDRTRRADSALELNVVLFSVAAVLTLAGMYLQERWLTTAALVLLLGGVVLRIAMRPRGSLYADDEDDDVGTESDSADDRDLGSTGRE